MTAVDGFLGRERIRRCENGTVSKQRKGVKRRACLNLWQKGHSIGT